MSLQRRKPLLLDLFCGAGGAAVGYARAGFEVVGVDLVSQPHYPFEFHQADALTFPLDGFDAIHASPPCQHYSAAANIHDSAADHPDLIPFTRALLIRAGVPWVMENVERSTISTTFMLCGSMFGLGVKRHRVFESSHLMFAPQCGSHSAWYASVFGGRAVGRQRVVKDWQPGTRKQTWEKFYDELAVAGKALGVDWMTLPELSECIPPAYTEFLGTQLLAALEAAA